MSTASHAPTGPATPPWFVDPEARTRPGAPTSKAARACHRVLPGYAVTPLVETPALAQRWSVGRVFVKDESTRFGLPAFKALGASYAVARLLADAADAPVCTSWEDLLAQAQQHPMTLVTATDGNHGRALAHIGALLGLPVEVVVPRVLTQAAEAAIAADGAVVTRIAGSYDEAVVAAADRASSSGSTLVQDTAWPGYEKVPGWIVDGYQTMLAETSAKLASLGLAEPDLVAVPVGVGSLAQAVVAYYRGQDPPAPTSVLSCEPDTAACVLASLVAGEPTTVSTGSTMMAGLNCGTTSGLAWPVLHAGLDAAIAVTEAQASRAVEHLAALGVDAGASGAASLAGVEAALTGPEGKARRAGLGLADDAVVVLLNTEGSTGAGGMA